VAAASTESGRGESALGLGFTGGEGLLALPIRTGDRPIGIGRPELIGAGAGRLLGCLGLDSQSERRLVPAAQGRPARKVGRGPQKAAGRNRFFFFQLILQNTVLVILFKF
jgi:hypothetical protein